MVVLVVRITVVSKNYDVEIEFFLLLDAAAAR